MKETTRLMPCEHFAITQTKNYEIPFYVTLNERKKFSFK